MWDKLKDALFEQDPGASKPAVSVPTAPAATLTAGPSMAAPLLSPGVNPEFVAAIRKAVMGRNTALTQLMATADKMSNIIADPQLRLKAAYAAAGDGRSVKQIIDAVDVHLSDVDGEELRFKTAMDGKVHAELAPLEQQHVALAGQIKSSQEQIASLQARIIELTNNIGTMTQQQAEASTAIANKRQELSTMADSFKAAAAAVRSELQANKATISSALS